MIALLLNAACPWLEGGETHGEIFVNVAEVTDRSDVLIYNQSIPGAIIARGKEGPTRRASMAGMTGCGPDFGVSAFIALSFEKICFFLS